MSAVEPACLSDERLLAFATGGLSGEELAGADAHLDSCEPCRDVVAELAHGAGGGGSLARGAVVGRYLITGILGRGAMGVVYSAYDPELDRKIALKLVRPEIAASRSEHLLREARAMARLSHPNVVGVYDAGTQHGTVFVAMEHVAGESLREWLVAGEHRWRDVRDVFMQAGRGLAAAHRAGLVHRDFKPENALIDADGVVKVGDFGLAIGDGGSLEGARDNRIAGTPAYMSPEQLRGEPADARSDQFSFCVAMFEALAGERPFPLADHGAGARATLPGATLEELAVAMSATTPALAPRTAPRWVERAVLQGLAADPDERHGSLDALIEAIDRQPARRSRWALAAAVPALAIGLLFFVGEGSGTPPCAGAADRAAPLWGEARADLLRRRLVTEDSAAFVAPAFGALEKTITGWRSDWVATHTRVCRATRVEGAQSERLLDVRMHCLDRGLRRASAIVGALEDADDATAGRVLSNIDALVEELPASSDCALLSEMTLQQPPTPSAAARLPALEDGVEAVRASISVGNHRAARERADDVLRSAREVGFAPMIAEASLVAAAAAQALDLDSDAEKLAHDAMLVAQSSHADHIAAQALITLMAVAARAGDFDRAEEWRALAAAIVERVGRPGDLSASLAAISGLIQFNRGQLAEARTSLLHALSLQREASGALARARLETGLGNIDRAERDYDRALERHRSALETNRAELGEMHPAVGRNLHNIAGVLRLQGRAAEAEKTYLGALDLKVAALGRDHSEVALTQNSLAIMALDAGDLERARPYLFEALATYQRLGRNERSGVLRNLGLLAERSGELESARDHLRAAIAIARKTIGPEHPRVAELEADLARVIAVLDPRTRARRGKPRATEEPTPAAAKPAAAKAVPAKPDEARPAPTYMPGQAWD